MEKGVTASKFRETRGWVSDRDSLTPSLNIQDRMSPKTLPNGMLATQPNCASAFAASFHVQRQGWHNQPRPRWIGRSPIVPEKGYRLLKQIVTRGPTDCVASDLLLEASLQ